MTMPSRLPHPADALVLARIPAPVRERAMAVRLMVFDVDGVLTDGSLYFGEHGEMFKRSMPWTAMACACSWKAASRWPS